jgi:hypothetical protein
MEIKQNFLDESFSSLQKEKKVKIDWGIWIGT